MGIDFKKVRLILWKEWIEIRQQRALVLGLIFLPILFTLLPLGLVFVMGQTPPDQINGVKSLLEIANANPSLRNLTGQELVQAVIGQPVSIMLFLLPVLLPSIIASYSIVGEKVNRTLEPVLAAPVTTFELLLGKILGALLPALLVTWLFGAIFALGMLGVTRSHSVYVAIISPSWFLLILLCAPLLAVISIAVTVAASSRANDPRTAQQISALVILPIVLIIVGQLAGLLILSPIVTLVVALIFAIIAAGVTWVATLLFRRETILTRWS